LKLDLSQEKKHEADFTSIYNFSAEKAGCISFYCCHQLKPDFVTKAAVRHRENFGFPNWEIPVNFPNFGIILGENWE